MPTVPLPDNPSLEQLRKQAKDLRDLARAGVPGALDLVAAHHPGGRNPVGLAGAQLVVARHYGFTSWARLKRHLEFIEHYRRVPDEVPNPTGLTDEFLVLACLRYGDDAPARWERAARLLAEQPGIAQSSIHAAAAAADADRGACAAARRSGARRQREGGPYRWEPLLYLAYARHDPAVSEAATLGTARLLLDHGADPNAGYLWHGLIPPFTALTGALGSGEGDQPEHPHAFALASLLLDAGADANDGQALYNRQFGSGRPPPGPAARPRAGPRRRRSVAGPARPHHRLARPSWCAASSGGRSCTTCATGCGCWPTTAPTSAPRSQAPGGRPSWARTSDGRTPAEVAALAAAPRWSTWLVSQGAARPAADGCRRADRRRPGRRPARPPSASGPTPGTARPSGRG